MRVVEVVRHPTPGVGRARKRTRAWSHTPRCPTSGAFFREWHMDRNRNFEVSLVIVCVLSILAIVAVSAVTGWLLANGV